MMKKIAFLVFTAISIVALTTMCRPAMAWRQASGSQWHTTYHITYEASSDLSDSITSAMHRVEMSLSPFNPRSAISAINRGESDRVDELIITVFDKSQSVNRISHGAFDPTVAPLINLWGFGYTDAAATTPSQEQIDSCLTLVGIADCHIADGRLIKKAAGTQFNFSAITKGYGVDFVADALRRGGSSNYMVEIGGELSLSGHNPQGKPWRVMIDAPVADDPAGHTEMAVIEVSDCAIATSGNYRNWRYDSDGHVVSHTISPVTGRPVVTTTLSATVIAPTCMEADALATACMAMDADEALDMIEALGRDYSALLVIADGTSMTLRPTSHFPKY